LARADDKKVQDFFIVNKNSEKINKSSLKIFAIGLDEIKKKRYNI
jgi:hypothetical protein